MTAPRGTKVLNQRIYSPVVYGGESAGDDLTLEASLSGSKGPVRVSGSLLEIVIAGQIGQVIHTNTNPRVYALPDNTGTLFCSGYFTTANQLVYSASAGVFGILNSASSAALITNSFGVISWATGVDGQYLGVQSGLPGFYALPDSGTIASSVGNTVPIYSSPGPSNDLVPLSTIDGRALLSTPTIAWALIAPTYLSGPSGLPLTAGTAAQVLTATGDGNFAWQDPNLSLINAGAQFSLPYYSAIGSGSTVSASSFLATDETTRFLKLQNQGRIRFFESTVNGTQYVELRAASSLAASVAFVLPTQDGVSGASLVTDGTGNLSFSYIDNGSVASALANQIAYYAVAGNDVQGLATISNTVLCSPAGALTWTLLTANYLSTVGGAPLGNGTSNQVLISDGAGDFAWATATDLTGEVRPGLANAVAIYPNTGTKVDDSGFLSVDEILHLLKIVGGVQFYNGANYIGLTSPGLTASTTFVLPSADGTNGQAILTDGSGNLSFQSVGRGIVHTGAANTFAYYQGATNEVYPFTNTAERIAGTDVTNAISWLLITAKYLSTTGNTPLPNGDPGNVLISDGGGNFLWTTAESLVGKVSSGTINRLPFYSGTTEITGSSFISTNESGKVLDLLFGGALTFHNGSFGVSFVAPTLASSTSYVFPATDASLSGQVLVSDGSGNLSWQDQVDPGTINALAYYSDTTRHVHPTTNVTLDSSGFAVSGINFGLIGSSGSSPTALNVTAGNSSGAAAGGSLGLYAGDSASGTNGVLTLGVGAVDLLTIVKDLTSYLALSNSMNLRFMSGVNYAGFKAGSMAAPVVWTLPVSDGAYEQVLSTNGSGILGWSTASGTVSSGTTGKLAVYTGSAVVDASTLGAPTGVPAANGTGLIVDTTGSMSYQMLVTPGATDGQVAFYSNSQTINYNAALYYMAISKALELRDNGILKLFESVSNGTDYVAIQSPALVATSYTITLPPAPPPTVGQTLVFDTSGVASFAIPGEDSALNQKGRISVPPSAEEVTVMFPSPFQSAPKTIVAQWAMTNTDLPSFLPTIAVDQVSFQGFVLQFSATTPDSGAQYTIYWEAYLNGTQSQASYVFLAGGDAGGTLSSDVLSLQMDVDTTALALAASFANARGYAASTSSTTTGFIFGGSEGVVPAPVGRISSFTYQTFTLANLVTTLATIRSGASGVGDLASGYVVGGQNTGGAIHSIEKFVYLTNTISTIAATLTNDSYNRASATSTDSGYVVTNSLSSIVEILSYGLDTMAVGPTSFGTANIQGGCNDTLVGYFAKGTGSLYSYNFPTDVITPLAASLTTSSGIVSSGNSLRKGYFVGASLVEALSFRTQTVTTVNTMANAYQATSTTAFQSGGLL
jgi:hypothetical protein